MINFTNKLTFKSASFGVRIAPLETGNDSFEVNFIDYLIETTYILKFDEAFVLAKCLLTERKFDGS